MLQRRDIPHILANQRFFYSIRTDIDTWLYLHYGEDEEPVQGSSAAAHPLRPSFTPEEPPSTKPSYKVWKLSLQFGHEPITTFAQHPLLSLQQLIDLHVLSNRIIQSPESGNFICSPMWNRLVPGSPLTDIFTLRAYERPKPQDPTAKCPLLILKMVCHLSIAFTMRPGNDGIWILLMGLLADCTDKTVQAIVQKYGLDIDWE